MISGGSRLRQNLGLLRMVLGWRDLVLLVGLKQLSEPLLLGLRTARHGGRDRRRLALDRLHLGRCGGSGDRLGGSFGFLLLFSQTLSFGGLGFLSGLLVGLGSQGGFLVRFGLRFRGLSGFRRAVGFSFYRRFLVALVLACAAAVFSVFA